MRIQATAQLALIMGSAPRVVDGASGVVHLEPLQHAVPTGLFRTVFDGRGPQRGCAARPASARPGMGTPEPHAGAALAGTAPALLAGGGPPCGIPQPFAPTLPAVQTARPPRVDRSMTVFHVKA